MLSTKIKLALMVNSVLTSAVVALNSISVFSAIGTNGLSLFPKALSKSRVCSFVFQRAFTGRDH